MSGFFWFGGAPEAQLAGGPQDLTPALFADADSFYAPTVTTPTGWNFVAVGAIGLATSNNILLAEPAGSAEGDLLVACIAYRNPQAFTLPAGWSLVATQQSSGDTTSPDGIASGLMAYIVRGSSAPSYTFTRTGGDIATGYVVGYRGNAAAPYDTGSANTLGSASATVTTGTITTAEASELIVAMGAGGDSYTWSAFDAATDPATASGATDTTTEPTYGTWIERVDAGTLQGSNTSIAIADAVRSAAGATGTIQVTSSGSSRGVMIAGAFKLVGSGAQDLTPGLYADADTFYTPVLTGAYTLTPALYTDADTFYAATVSATYGLTPGLFTDADAFHAATVTGAYGLTPALFVDADTFQAPVVATTYGLTPGLFTDADIFYTPTLAAGAVNLTPGLYTDADTFYAPTVAVGAVNLTPSLFVDADTFYAPTVSTGAATQDLTPGLYVDGDTFYSATVAASNSLLPAYYDDPDLFHAPAVTGAYGLTPALYADADTFYSEIVAQAGGPQFILPPYYDDPDIFHAALVAESQSVTQASWFDDPDEFYAAHVSRVGRGGVTRFRPLAYG